jgi:hypothetical protein
VQCARRCAIPEEGHRAHSLEWRPPGNESALPLSGSSALTFPRLINTRCAGRRISKVREGRPRQHSLQEIGRWLPWRVKRPWSSTVHESRNLNSHTMPSTMWRRSSRQGKNDGQRIGRLPGTAQIDLRIAGLVLVAHHGLPELAHRARRPSVHVGDPMALPPVTAPLKRMIGSDCPWNCRRGQSTSRCFCHLGDWRVESSVESVESPECRAC